jgi:myosin heavy subunit
MTTELIPDNTIINNILDNHFIEIEELKDSHYKEVQSLKKQIQELKDNLKNVRKSNRELQNENMKYKNTNSNLLSHNKTLHKDLEKIQEYADVKDAEIDSLDEKLQDMYIQKKPKKKISQALRKAVWDKFIGKEIGSTKCLCCKVEDINQFDFHCGHIISEKMGGKTNLQNLKPICKTCNSSMAIENMNDFIKRNGF